MVLVLAAFSSSGSPYAGYSFEITDFQLYETGILKWLLFSTAETSSKFTS